VCAEDAELRAAASFETAMIVEPANRRSSISWDEGEPEIPEPSRRRFDSFGCDLAALPLSAALDFLMASNTLPIVTSQD
jgi:hypothetical protein